MAEALTELEKLQKAAKLIEEMSQGRLQVCPSVVGQVYIRPQTKPILDWLCGSTVFPVSRTTE